MPLGTFVQVIWYYIERGLIYIPLCIISFVKKTCTNCMYFVKKNINCFETRIAFYPGNIATYVANIVAASRCYNWLDTDPGCSIEKQGTLCLSILSVFKTVGKRVGVFQMNFTIWFETYTTPLVLLYNSTIQETWNE